MDRAEFLGRQFDLFDIPATETVVEEFSESEQIPENAEVIPIFSDAEQAALFGDLPVPELEELYARIYVHFETAEDIAAFAEAIGQPVTTQTRIICYPEAPLAKYLA